MACFYVNLIYRVISYWQDICEQQHLFDSSLSRTTRVSQYQKGKTNLDLLEQETMSGSGISWAICKSAPCHRKITTPAPHSIVTYYRYSPLLSFLQAECSSCHSTSSVNALKAPTTRKPFYILPLKIQQLNHKTSIFHAYNLGWVYLDCNSFTSATSFS